MTYDEAVKEILDTEKLIDKAYQEAKVKRPVKFFRFPYGDKGGKNKKEIQNYLKSLGYRQPKFEKINYFWYKSGVQKLQK